MFYETSRHILENNYEKLQDIFLSSIYMEFNLGRNIDYLGNPLNKLSSEIESILNEMFEYCCKIHNIKNSIKNKYIKKFITSNEIYFYITKELDINIESIYSKEISLESKRIEINKYSKEQNLEKNLFKKGLKTIVLELILPGWIKCCNRGFNFWWNGTL